MTNQILPKIREDLTLRSESENGQEFVIIIDPLGLMQEDIAIPLGFLPLVQMLDGLTTMDELKQFLDENLLNSNEIIPLFTKVIAVLDDYAMLETDTYFDQLELLDLYYASPVRPATLAGIAYAKDSSELSEDLTKMLNHYPDQSKINNAKAVIVPHIDFYTGGAAQNCYSLAYKSIEETDADLYVIFGTSHYFSSSEFMLTLKDYETPLGTLQTDTEVIDEIAKHLNIEKYIDDAAHRLEHSIEMQTVLLQTKFKNKSFKILPILCGSYFNNSDDDTAIDNFISVLKLAISKLGRNVVYIVSADLAHIGAKHNSPLAASENRTELEKADRELITEICGLSATNVKNKLKTECEKWQICGATPIYTLLKLNEFSNAELEYYGQYLEYEFDSAVSFATVSFQ